MNSTLTMSAPTEHTPARKSFTRYFPPVARVLMGLLFLVSGANGFLNFLPQPKVQLSEGALAFVGALMGTGYMLPLIFGTMSIVGALLLANRFVPLALALIAPFIVHSVAFHIYLESSGLPMALVVLGLELYLAWSYREAFRPMLVARMART
jgi:uncharacterized membrane protein YphA (DoxX/SURF4 family)